MSIRSLLTVAAAILVGAAAMTALSVDSSTETAATFGSTVSTRPGESLDAARERVEAEIGSPPVVRVFFPGPPGPWRRILQSAGDADIVVSFKIPPQQIIDGSMDEELRSWFKAAPSDRDVYWVYFHEPEDNVEEGEFTAAEFVKAWGHIAGVARKVDNDRLVSAVVLMCWTLQASSERDWLDYVPTGEVGPAVLAWDCYNQQARAGGYQDSSALFDASVEASEEIGADWAIAELGSLLVDRPTERARWLCDVAAYARRNDAAFVTYFNSRVGGRFELTDRASQRAWRSIMEGETCDSGSG